MRTLKNLCASAVNHNAHRSVPVTGSGPHWAHFAAFCAQKSRPFPLISLIGDPQVVQQDAAAVARVAPPDGHSFQSLWPGGQHLLMLIAQPPTETGGEAHFIAVTHSTRIEILTLERGLLQRTMLCGWTPRQHVNYGGGPEPVADLFLYAVCRHLKIPDTIEPPTRNQGLCMSKVPKMDMTIPTPLPVMEERNYSSGKRRLRRWRGGGAGAMVVEEVVEVREWSGDGAGPSRDARADEAVRGNLQALGKRDEAGSLWQYRAHYTISPNKADISVGVW